MSLFGGGSNTVYVPTQAPAAPTKTNDPINQRLTFNQYKTMQRGNQSYTQGILGGGAPPPKKSYSAGLFSGAGAAASGV